MKPSIDFWISSDPYKLRVLDESIWSIIENQPAIIEITLPGNRSYTTKYFEKNAWNIFNSFALDVNCYDECTQPDIVTLPDGIYKVKVVGSPSTFFNEKSYLKHDLFDMELDKLFINNKEMSSDFLNKVYQIDLLIRGAEAHLKYDLVSISNQQFEKACEMLEDLKNCKTCSHGLWM